MQTHVEKIDATTVKLRIKVPSQEMMPHFLEGLNRANIVLGNHSKDKPKAVNPAIESSNPFVVYVRRDVCDAMMKTKFPLAVQQNQLMPLSKPEFESEVWQENTDFIFTAKFEVRPEIKSINTKSLKINPEKNDVTEAMIEDAIMNMRRSQQTLTEDQNVTIAAPGCTVLFDIDAYRGNVLFQPACAHNQILEIKKGPDLTPIEKCLIGMRRHEERTFEFTHPLDSADKHLAGQKVTFHVKLKGFKVVTLPEFNDQFVVACFQGAAADILGVTEAPKTVSEFKNYLRSEFTFRQHAQYFEQEKLSILAQLVDQNPIDVPKALVEGQYNSLVLAERNLFLRTQPNKNFDLHISVMKASMLDRSVRMVRCALIVDFLARNYKLQFTDSDYEAFFDYKAKEMARKKEFLKRTMNYPHAKSQVAYMILEDKVVRHILRSNAPKLKVA